MTSTIFEVVINVLELQHCVHQTGLIYVFEVDEE